MKSVIIFVGLISLIASNGAFLRNLAAAAAIDVSAVEYKDAVCGTIPSGFKFELTCKDSTTSGAAISAAVTSTIVKFQKGTEASSTIATTCEFTAVTDAATPFKVKCSTTGTGKVADGYKLQGISDYTSLDGASGADKLKLDAATVNTPITAKTGYNAPGNNTANSKEYYLSNATFPIKFEIAMTNAMTAVPTIKAGNVTLTSLCKVDTTTTSKLTCSLEKDTLTGSKEGTTYKITATNVCSEEEETGVTIKVLSASSFLTVSKFALVLLALFFC